MVLTIYDHEAWANAFSAEEPAWFQEDYFTPYKREFFFERADPHPAPAAPAGPQYAYINGKPVLPEDDFFGYYGLNPFTGLPYGTPYTGDSPFGIDGRDGKWFMPCQATFQ